MNTHVRKQLHWKPDAVCFSTGQFRDWIFEAQPGERCLYHIGLIGEDQEKRRDLKGLGDYAAMMAEFGVVLLTQRRRQEGQYEYFAAKTEHPTLFAPKALAKGEITPRLFTVLRSIDDRDKGLSVTRAVAHALGSDEASARAIVLALVRGDLLNPGKPPAVPPSLTPLGLSMLS